MSMKRTSWLLGILLVFCQVGLAQQGRKSLGDIARRTRAERSKRDLSKVRLYTNDNLPSGATISVLGRATPPPNADASSSAGAEAAAGDDGCDEKCWRGKFDAKRAAVASVTKELDVLQREFNLNRMAYSTDPNANLLATSTGTTAGGPANQEVLAQMEAKRNEMNKLNRELLDLQQELRTAGKPAGWGRAPAAPPPPPPSQ